MNLITKTSAHVFPRVCPAAPGISATVAGERATVYRACVADFVCCTIAEPTEVVITLASPPASAAVRPQSRNIASVIDSNRVVFTLPRAMDLRVDISGRPPLHIHANPPSQAPEGPRVVRFAAGQVYEVGEFRLTDGQTLYIEPGAVVRGSVRAANAGGICIAGPGVLDGSYYTRGIDGRRTIELSECPAVRVSDITLINPTAWMTELQQCDGAVVSNYRGIGEGNGSDGIDIVGSSGVTIDNCMILNHDDQVVVKSFRKWNRPVDGVLVKGCIFANVRNGASMEIGHELTTEYVRNVTFRDIDVLECHGHSAVFSIRTGDRAAVSDVLYDDIRVEHYYEKLADFRVIRSRYSRDTERGTIRNVTMKNVSVAESEFNPGYSISTIGGFDAEHDVRGVRFEDFRIGGRKVLSADALDLFTRHAHDITFA